MPPLRRCVAYDRGHFLFRQEAQEIGALPSDRTHRREGDQAHVLRFSDRLHRLDFRREERPENEPGAFVEGGLGRRAGPVGRAARVLGNERDPGIARIDEGELSRLLHGRGDLLGLSRCAERQKQGDLLRSGRNLRNCVRIARRVFEQTPEIGAGTTGEDERQEPEQNVSPFPSPEPGGNAPFHSSRILRPQMPPPARYTIDGHLFEAEPLSPGLYLTATPIGNLRDVTLRALATLAAADEILCEDTRITVRLTSRYGIATRLSPYHDHNAAKVRPRIIAALRAGGAITLVSDAGTPLVSDPGYKLAREAIANGIRVEAVPGPSAALAALASSGLPSDRFLFAGFLPEKAGERQAALSELKGVRASLIFFESAKRLSRTLSGLADILGDRPAA